MLRLSLATLSILAVVGCAGDDGFSAEEAETLCRIRFEQAERRGISCIERPLFLEECSACFMDCQDCVAEFNTCPPIISFCE